MPSVAVVGNDATVTAVAPGQSIISAAVDGKSASTTISVVDAPPATIRIAQGPRSVEEAKTLHLDAVAKDAAGIVLTVSANWRSADVEIATVSADGTVTGVAASATPARIVASVAASATTTLADTVLITVTPALVATIQVGVAAASIEVGEGTAATATLRGDAGQLLTGRAVTWSSSAPNVATVSSLGAVTGISIGTATISAQREGKTGSVTVQVVAAAPDRIDLSPAAASIALGGAQTITATVRDRRGGLLAGCPITWSTSNPAVATVNAGVVTGVAIGSASITAQCLTKQATASITVTQGPSLSITAIYLYGTSTLANLANLSGLVEVVAEYAFAGQTPMTLELLVDGQVVRSQPVPTSGGCSSFCRLPLNTSYFNGGTGPVSILNGSRTIGVRLNFQGTASLLASAPAVFNNRDEFLVDQIMSPSGGLTNYRGEQWYGGPNGSATFTLVPLIHTPGRTVRSVSVKLGSGPTLTDDTTPFDVVVKASTYAGIRASLRAMRSCLSRRPTSVGHRAPRQSR